MARSFKKTPSHGISDNSANHTRRLRRKARRNHNRRVVAALVACVDIAAAADATLYMTRQEADGNHWGKGYFGHLMAQGWYAERGAKFLRK